MSNWEQFKKKTESFKDGEKPPFESIEGNYLCQMCRESIDEADYFFNDSVLRWKCSKGHVSFLENFNLW